MRDRPQHIHLMGICGTGMTSLATLLVEAGYQVTGSDQNIYPPMSTQLKQLGIALSNGYAASNLDSNPDLVVIGNVIRRDNPEAQETLKRGLPYRSMPQALSELFLASRTPIVVAGTHGKSTLATLTTWLLEAAGTSPGFFVGAVGKNFGTGARIGQGPFFVIEGDEYDTAFFDKGPKFLHYRPHFAILTSIEFDHADIYRNLDHLKESFAKLVEIIPPDGMLIACSDYAQVLDITSRAHCRIVTYGLSKGSYTAHMIDAGPGGTRFSIMGPQGEQTYTSPLYGAHNLQNAAAAIALLCESGIAPAKIQKGLNSFQGLARRQDVVGEEQTVTVIDDFAHHPTAVRETIAAMRMKYPARRLWTLFEPRSNTSRRKVFQKDFAQSFGKADRVIIAGVYRADLIPPDERLDPAALATDIGHAGTEAHYIQDTEHILQFVLDHVRPRDVILVMSNGIFDNIATRIVNGLKARAIGESKPIG